ncbi:putative membrane protein (plasmid) [Fusobacterium varium]|nr:putative membrane protein [Fusobacterium varium]
MNEDYLKIGIYESIKTINDFLKKVFLWMSVNSLFMVFLFMNLYFKIHISFKYLPMVIILKIYLIFLIKYKFEKLNYNLLKFLFFLYFLINVIFFNMLSLIINYNFICYILGIKFFVFLFVTLFSYNIKDDISSYRHFFIIYIKFILIISLISFLFATSLFYYLISILGITIFFILVLQKTNKIKKIVLKKNLTDKELKKYVLKGLIEYDLCALILP